jgi:hypothetical protein
VNEDNVVYPELNAATLIVVLKGGVITIASVVV